jgi:Flp pilus assembly pilin Flp
MNLLRKLRGVGRDERGLSTVEYTVLLVLIVASAVGLWNRIGGDLVKKLKASATEVEKVKVSKN